jgi:hypothetical protein
MTDFNRIIREAAGYAAEPSPAPPAPASSNPNDAAWLAAEGPVRQAIEREAARAGFIDPTDATARLRYKVPMGADGLPEPQALRKAVADVAHRSPHLVDRQPLGAGSGDGGARRSPPPPTDFNEVIRAAAWGSKIRAAEEKWPD